MTKKKFCGGIACSSLVEYIMICGSYIQTGYVFLFFDWLTGTEIFVLGEKADTATAPTESKKSWALTIFATDNEELCTWNGIPSLLEKGRGHGHTSSSSDSWSDLAYVLELYAFVRISHWQRQKSLVNPWWRNLGTKWLRWRKWWQQTDSCFPFAGMNKKKTSFLKTFS